VVAKALKKTNIPSPISKQVAWT